MQSRKLVKAGPSSFTIALPKDWIDKNQLKKGDAVYVRKISGNELLVTTDQTFIKHKEREITITLDDQSIGTVRRKLTSAYINHFTTIRITGKDLFKHIKQLRDIIQGFVALEITEQTSKSIIARDMLNLQEVSITKTIRRMDNIVRSMFQDVTAPNQTEDLSESIQFRDQDVDRLYFLLSKIVKSSLKDPDIAKLVGIQNNVDILSIWYMIVNLESIADNLREIYSAVSKANKPHKESKDGKEKEAPQNTLLESAKQINESYINVMKAYHNQNKNDADAVASNRLAIAKELESISQKTPELEVIKTTENLREIVNNISNIARIVMDTDNKVDEQENKKLSKARQSEHDPDDVSEYDQESIEPPK